MKKEAIITKCIDDIRSGHTTLEACLARYPHLRRELISMLKTSSQIEPPEVLPSLAFKQRARDRLLEIIQQESTKSSRPPFIRWIPLPARMPALAAVAFIIILLVSVTSAAVNASNDSLPGDRLYPVKTTVEKLRLAVTLDSKDRAYFRLQLVGRRIDEVALQSTLNRKPSTSALPSVSLQIDSAIREIGSAPAGDIEAFANRLISYLLDQQLVLNEILKITPEEERQPLRQTISVMQRGGLIAQVTYTSPAFLKKKPSVRDERLEENRFEAKGKLLYADGPFWNIGGLKLNNVSPPRELLPVGSLVRIDGISTEGQIYIIKAVHSDEEEDEVEVKGVFRGASSDGATWQVAGITMPVQSDSTVPEKGDSLRVTGIVKDDILTVTQVEREDKGEEGSVEIEGTLGRVDVDANTITVYVGGAQVTINVSRATVKTAMGPQIALRDLVPLAGRLVEAEGVYRVNGVFYADEVCIDSEGNRYRQEQQQEQGWQSEKEEERSDGGDERNSEGEQNEESGDDEQDEEGHDERSDGEGDDREEYD